MSKHKAENVPGKADGQKKNTWYPTIIELAKKGVSNRSIAARLGISIDDFVLLIEHYPQVKEALALARAEFEITRVEAKDAILNDPDTSKGLKYKIIREDLKTLEEWAPATRAVKVQVESAVTELNFEALSPAEIEKIVQEQNGPDAESKEEDS